MQIIGLRWFGMRRHNTLWVKAIHFCCAGFFWALLHAVGAQVAAFCLR